MIAYFFKINYINFYLHKLEVKNYQIILNIFNKNIFILNDTFQFKYNWSEIYSSEEDIYLYFVKCNKNTKILNKISKQNKNPVLNKILFKKKSSIFKKNFDFNYLILNKIFSYKNNFNKSLYSSSKTNKKKEEFFYNNKFLDLKRKLKLNLKKNRETLRFFFKIKEYRNFSLNKALMFFCKSNKRNLFLTLENNIVNIIMRTDIFFSKNDCIWFLQNGMISVNSIVERNIKLVLNSNDIINISNFSYYFFFYKNNFNFLNNNIYKINLKLWSINNNRFKNIERLPLKENYPKWIENYKYFKKDTPLYLEIDYISLTICLLKYNFEFKHLDYYNLIFFSFFMNRSYNWKFIV